MGFYPINYADDIFYFAYIFETALKKTLGLNNKGKRNLSQKQFIFLYNIRKFALTDFFFLRMCSSRIKAWFLEIQG